jgi:hypothetical protein
VAPSITTQPASQTVTAGQIASFSVVATGTAPLGYQWNKNGAAISGATSSSYTTPATTTSDNGALFTVLVSNTAGSVTSSAATLTVSAAPVAPSITTQPASQTVTAGQIASFSVVATGTAPLSYQWQKNSVAISGATSSSYTTPATTSSDNGAQFTAVVSNTAGSVTSSAAALTVNPAPAPAIQVSPTSINFGSAVVGSTLSQVLIITNTGTALLSITQVTASGSAFTVSGFSLPLNVSPGQQTTITVAFLPTSAGVASGNVVIVSNAPTSPTSVGLSGTGIAATYTLGISPTSLSFGSVTTGTSSAPQNVTITNTGNSNVTISQINVLGAGFSASGVSAGTILTSNQSVTLNVVFAPTVAGIVTGSVTVVSNATNSPTTIALSGTGAVALISVSLSPTSATLLSGQSQQFTATVTGSANTGVTWSATAGSISSSGLFTAPSVSANTTVTVTATSIVDPTKSALGLVTVTGSSTIINVLNYGATGNGTTNDTAAINNAIAALTSGATLLFPCGTYLVTGQLTINVSNVTVDGSSCATIRNIASGTIMVLGPSSGSPNYGPAIALSATANELATSFATVSSLGVAQGDYIRMSQGGKDSSAGSGDTGCDAGGCRTELLKIASVSGNTITVTTALHATYDPSVNAATAQRLLGPLTGITVKNITFDGGGSNVYGFRMAGVTDSAVTGVTSKNVQGSAIINYADFNVTWTNITITGAGSAACGSSAWFENQGNLSINGMTISNENPGTGGGCLGNGAFGFSLHGSANSTITNLTVDAAGAYGRPLKTISANYNTFNSLTVKNGVSFNNGISLEYYSSHNTFNNCVVTNNGANAGTGNGNAGINLFGNFNQYNTFNNCIVSGNGNLQVLVSNFDALRLGQDSYVTINSGTYTGTNTVLPVIAIIGTNAYVTSANINGPRGLGGLYLGSITACVNNNTFGVGAGSNVGIWSNGSTNIGYGNVLNGYSSNLTPGTCTAP